MSFKYRFILSFVLLEIFFISLIVTINFVAISNSSNKLINERIESNITFLEELIKVPISIYDLATLDNLLYKTEELELIDSIVILDNQNRILSESYDFKYMKLDDLIKTKKDFTYEINNELFEIKYKKVYEVNTYLGSMYVVFDKSDNEQFISNNKKNTILIIILEILLSTLLSYLIGSKLTKKLTNLAAVAKEIGKDKSPIIPYLNTKDEIGILSNSMNQMQIDLHERNEKLKQFARELNKQKDDLIEANRAKDDFLANMSHELKTPLNSINVISSIMMKNKTGKLDEKEVKSLTIINNSGKDLLNLINEVLDISKLEAGEIIITNNNINIYSLLCDVYSTFEAQVSQKNLDFVLNCDEKIGFINSDENRIKQILKNLISNSLKFTKEGTIEISAKIEKEFLVILVKDDGIGIAKEKLEHIFDRFKQADSSTTRQYGGTGLGLAISKDLSNLLGGNILVESEVGKGSTFKVLIKINNEKKD